MRLRKFPVLVMILPQEFLSTSIQNEIKIINSID
jgi:hypothetical protein